MKVVTNSFNLKTKNILLFFVLFSFLINSQENYNKNVLKISDEEITNHRSFLKKELKKNFY